MQRKNTPLIVWLFTLTFLVILMVIVGGVTRLTDSGLSMVEWKPLLGIIPPLSEKDWMEVFEKYKLYPQFQNVNFHMTLKEFKSIFFWEYLHRFLGRFIAIIFLLPYFFLNSKKKIPTSYKKPLLFAFLLGGIQAIVGWWMVKSGLIDNPRVSHYRLMIHLLIALSILSIFIWILTDALGLSFKKTVFSARKHLILFLHLLLLQIIYGAFMAGTRAGYLFNTFPKMGPSWIPDGLWAQSNLFLNFINNPVMIHFIHRILAFIILFYTFFLWFKGKKNSSLFLILFLLVVFQILLGIKVVILSVPISIAAIHQLTGVLIWSLTISLIKQNKKAS
ncbi:MAG: heme A synthase [Bdellovibrio sp.]|nr:MAG: heme A synthase [Bdellovibrio sp.]